MRRDVHNLRPDINDHQLLAARVDQVQSWRQLFDQFAELNQQADVASADFLGWSAVAPCKQDAGAFAAVSTAPDAGRVASRSVFRVGDVLFPVNRVQIFSDVQAQPLKDLLVGSRLQHSASIHRILFHFIFLNH